MQVKARCKEVHCFVLSSYFLCRLSVKEPLTLKWPWWCPYGFRTRVWWKASCWCGRRAREQERRKSSDGIGAQRRAPAQPCRPSTETRGLIPHAGGRVSRQADQKVKPLGGPPFEMGMGQTYQTEKITKPAPQNSSIFMAQLRGARPRSSEEAHSTAGHWLRHQVLRVRLWVRTRTLTSGIVR